MTARCFVIAVRFKKDPKSLVITIMTLIMTVTMGILGIVIVVVIVMTTTKMDTFEASIISPS